MSVQGSTQVERDRIYDRDNRIQIRAKVIKSTVGEPTRIQNGQNYKKTSEIGAGYRCFSLAWEGGKLSFTVRSFIATRVVRDCYARATGSRDRATRDVRSFSIRRSEVLSVIPVLFININYSISSVKAHTSIYKYFLHTLNTRKK